ncbi:hypothetical protein, partial [Xanthomonas campestris]|uniref:hypothetical protein n=1 Tax=Xanthomonas campestris TaxID=339 RepID=UPI003D701BC1
MERSDGNSTVVAWTLDRSPASGGAGPAGKPALLEPVHDLLSNSAKKAKWMNCRLVLSLRSQFF